LLFSKYLNKKTLTILMSHTQNTGSDKLILWFSLLGIATFSVLKYVLNSGLTTYALILHSSFLSETVSLYQGDYSYSFTAQELPLLLVLVFGGLPLVWRILGDFVQGDFGADLLAGLSIITAVCLDEYLAGCLVVLMLASGVVLETYAVKKASSVLEALAKRMPSLAHKKVNGELSDISTDKVVIGDHLLVLPHEICPVDGTVLEGIGSMDESYLTGEPYLMEKTSGSPVMSGAINGDAALLIRADKLVVDSRYAKITEVMRRSEQDRPQLRRLGDQLGAWYAPLALSIAIASWWFSGDVIRFLAVLVIATPCPLLIGIPVVIISSISLAAKREIIIKNPAILETIGACSTAIFDKTGTLTYGRPSLIALLPAQEFDKTTILSLIASLERYSRHPLSSSIVKAAEQQSLALLKVDNIQESAGEGIIGQVDGKQIQVTSRKQALLKQPDLSLQLTPAGGGLECVVFVDDRYAALLQFRDEVRSDSPSFINHLEPNHAFDKVMIVSGDRESEVRYLAEKVGIEHIYFSQSPEQKLAIVKQETEKAKTVYLGDGINDAPALTAATIGIAFGQNSDITGESADAVIMDSSLLKVDELFHIGERMRTIALQSAIGGIILSFIGMVFAGYGYITPVVGAILQEFIDVIAILNALRAAIPPKTLSDY
jgi:heavy metal translocating P-type ATPase